jgi:hypothetical protein
VDSFTKITSPFNRKKKLLSIIEKRIIVGQDEPSNFTKKEEQAEITETETERKRHYVYNLEYDCLQNHWDSLGFNLLNTKTNSPFSSTLSLSTCSKDDDDISTVEDSLTEEDSNIEDDLTEIDDYYHQLINTRINDKEEEEVLNQLIYSTSPSISLSSSSSPSTSNSTKSIIINKSKTIQTKLEFSFATTIHNNSSYNMASSLDDFEFELNNNDDDNEVGDYVDNNRRVPMPFINISSILVDSSLNNNNNNNKLIDSTSLIFLDDKTYINPFTNSSIDTSVEKFFGQLEMTFNNNKINKSQQYHRVRSHSQSFIGFNSSLINRRKTRRSASISNSLNVKSSTPGEGETNCIYTNDIKSINSFSEQRRKRFRTRFERVNFSRQFYKRQMSLKMEQRLIDLACNDLSINKLASTPYFDDKDTLSFDYYKNSELNDTTVYKPSLKVEKLLNETRGVVKYLINYNDSNNNNNNNETTELIVKMNQNNDGTNVEKKEQNNSPDDSITTEDDEFNSIGLNFKLPIIKADNDDNLVPFILSNRCSSGYLSDL